MWLRWWWRSNWNWFSIVKNVSTTRHKNTTITLIESTPTKLPLKCTVNKNTHNNSSGMPRWQQPLRPMHTKAVALKCATPHTANALLFLQINGMFCQFRTVSLKNRPTFGWAKRSAFVFISMPFTSRTMMMAMISISRGCRIQSEFCASDASF